LIQPPRMPLAMILTPTSTLNGESIPQVVHVVATITIGTVMVSMMMLKTAVLTTLTGATGGTQGTDTTGTTPTVSKVTVQACTEVVTEWRATLIKVQEAPGMEA